MVLRLFILILTISLATPCPSKDLLYPCVCESSSSSKNIRCDGLDNDQALANAVNALKGVKDIYSLTIENAALNYIPHDLFEGVEIVELEFLTTSLMSFTDTDVAFEGLEDSLEILLVTDCSFMNSWDWSLLKGLKKLMRLDVIGGDLEDIGEDVKAISNLNMVDISFENNKISHVYDYAFSNFTELHFVSLRRNMVKEMKRSMLPNPAVKLRDIDLGTNLIERLPEDMFTNMPNLEVLTISLNKILTLNEKTFSPVWERLEHFSAMGNRLRCDCRMSWIINLRKPIDLRAICEQPTNLNGRNLATLTSRELWCM